MDGEAADSCFGCNIEKYKIQEVQLLCHSGYIVLSAYKWYLNTYILTSCIYLGEFIVSKYIAESMNNWLQDISATKDFVSWIQNYLLTINLPTMKSVAMSLYNIIMHIVAQMVSTKKFQK